MNNSIKDLITQLNYYTEQYNSGNPVISDYEWDTLYYKLREEEEKLQEHLTDSPTQCISYNVSFLNKVTHNHPMLSLDKTKDWNEFVQYFQDKDMICMLKLDGLTCSLCYENGCLIGAETRGNGIEGEDILHNALVIPSIPNTISYKKRLIIDGEIICKTDDFSIFANDYANTRNFASGSIRLLKSDECANRKLTFVAWNVVEGFDETNSFLKKLTNLDDLGFLTTPWTTGTDLDAKEFLIEEAKNYCYPIDGLVGRFDDIEYGVGLGSTNHHAKAAYAFKFYNEIIETELHDIEWSLGRSGKLTPIAIFKSIQLNDTTVNRANLHNYDILVSILGEKPYVGQKIGVMKANEIIPEVVEAEIAYDENSKFLDFPTVCPWCGGELIDFTCGNPSCSGILINRLDHFCSKKGIEIKGLSENTLLKLISWGWVNNLIDIFALKDHAKEWASKAGFGEKSVNKILAAIEEAKKCTFPKFLAALGIPQVGITASAQIAEKFKTWEDFIAAVNEGYNFATLPNFGEAINTAISSFDYTEANEIYNKYMSLLEPKETTENNTIKKTLEGKKIAITGKLTTFKNRQEFVDAIVARGGKVVSSITSTTDLLVNNDAESASAKNVAAKKYNIPVVTEQNFISNYFEI